MGRINPDPRAGLIQLSIWTKCTIDNEKKILPDKDLNPGAGLIRPSIWTKCIIDDKEKNSTTRLNEQKRINKPTRVIMD